eukprot:TRINITY_DN67079_c11_g1_i1.p1 TRINITY_DN67079_c11_g1~~TRINITY_DN67079_c11_g1_i1.p1  ORF type:complete len:313 (+),score=48.82 TRINITY_DN67079_c11_g1_i1:61-999(+)
MEDLCSHYNAVEVAFDDFIKNLTAVQDTAHETLLKFKQHRAVTQANLAKHNITTNGQKKVSLDIGGTVFNTTEETLLKEDSFFFSMLRSGQFQPDETTGQYFIDRSPMVFGVILDYLRDGKLWAVDSMSTGERALLRAELDFYQISPPQQSIMWDKPNPTTHCYGISKDCKTVVAAGFSGEELAPTTKFPEHGLVCFTLHVKHSGPFCAAEMPVVDVLGEADDIRYCNLQTGCVQGFPAAKFPSLEFPATGVEYDYKFCYNQDTAETTITWPTGQVKKFKGAEPLGEAMFAMDPSDPASMTSFTLIHTDWGL